MKQITKEQLDTIMHRWMAYCITIGLKPKSFRNVTLDMERAFVFGAACALLDMEAGDIISTMLPPIVRACWESGRPLASLGNWDADADQQRLSTASKTW